MAYSVAVANLGRLDTDLIQWAQTADYASLACRDVRHAWPGDPQSLMWHDANYRGRPVWEREAACLHNCGVSRVQRRDQITGEIYHPQYLYPKAENGERSPYLLPKGCGALNSDDIFELQMALAGPLGEPKKKTRRGRRR